MNPPASGGGEGWVRRKQIQKTKDKRPKKKLLIRPPLGGWGVDRNSNKLILEI